VEIITKKFYTLELQEANPIIGNQKLTIKQNDLSHHISLYKIFDSSSLKEVSSYCHRLSISHWKLLYLLTSNLQTWLLKRPTQWTPCIASFIEFVWAPPVCLL